MGLSKCIRLNLVKKFLLNQVTLDAVHPLHLKVRLCGKCLGKDAFWVLMSKPFSKNVTFHKTVISNPPPEEKYLKISLSPSFFRHFSPHPSMNGWNFSVVGYGWRDPIKLPVHVTTYFNQKNWYFNMPQQPTVVCKPSIFSCTHVWS